MFLTIESLRRVCRQRILAPVSRRQSPMITGDASDDHCLRLKPPGLLPLLGSVEATWWFKEVSAAIRFLARSRLLFCLLDLEK
ncbi:hypothetical protein Bca4012_010715 [Brassica carinata]